MKHHLLTAVAILSFGEVIALIVFWAVRKGFNMNEDGNVLRVVLGGILERLVLLIGLYMNATQILAMFGALKIATRIEDEGKKTNEYFLTGNLISVFFALAYYWVYLRLR